VWQQVGGCCSWRRWRDQIPSPCISPPLSHQTPPSLTSDPPLSPAAVLRTPSIPLAPRLAPTGTPKPAPPPLGDEPPPLVVVVGPSEDRSEDADEDADLASSLGAPYMSMSLPQQRESVGSKACGGDAESMGGWTGMQVSPRARARWGVEAAQSLSRWDLGAAQSLTLWACCSRGRGRVPGGAAAKAAGRRAAR